jgi:hypothetical protein
MEKYSERVSCLKSWDYLDSRRWFSNQHMAGPVAAKRHQQTTDHSERALHPNKGV